MGALSVTGLSAIKHDFEPLPPGGVRVPNTNFYRAPEFFADDEVAFGVWAADEIERAILREGAETVAAVFLEPVQNSGGCFPPPPGYFQRVREICDRYGVLLVSDEVICAFGRLGYWFGAERYGYQPDIITFAKGLTSGYSPLGGMIVRDELMEPFLQGSATFLHGFTFAGHPVSSAVALANLDVFEGDNLLGNVRANEDGFRAALDKLTDLPIVGNVRGAGYFYGIELVKDKDTKETFDDDESERLLRGFLSRALFDAGLDLPRRRPRRPGDPARPAADLQARSSSTRSSRSSARCSPKRGRSSDAGGVGTPPFGGKGFMPFLPNGACFVQRANRTSYFPAHECVIGSPITMSIGHEAERHRTLGAALRASCCYLSSSACRR